MLGFLVRRIIALAFVLLFAVTLTFCLLRLFPGSPFNLNEKQNSAANIAKEEYLHNLDGPIWWQWARYIGLGPKHERLDSNANVLEPAGYRGLLQGRFDEDSLKLKDRKVNELIADSMPTSVTIGLLALMFSTVAGVWLGSMAAVKRHTWIDTGSMLGALAAISIPTFVAGPLLALVFSLWLNWLPIGGVGGLSNLILPSLTLAGPFIAYIARLTRASLLEVLSQDFVRTARAKGVAERGVLYRHVLKIGILPVVSFLGPLTAGVLTGSLVVEKIFNLPGMGEMLVNSVLNQDEFLCCGTVAVYCALLVVMNLLVDVAYQWLDPRIRIS